MTLYRRWTKHGTLWLPRAFVRKVGSDHQVFHYRKCREKVEIHCTSLGYLQAWPSGLPLLRDTQKDLNRVNIDISLGFDLASGDVYCGSRSLPASVWELAVYQVGHGIPWRLGRQVTGKRMQWLECLCSRPSYRKMMNCRHVFTALQGRALSEPLTPLKIIVGHSNPSTSTPALYPPRMNITQNIGLQCSRWKEDS